MENLFHFTLFIYRKFDIKETNSINGKRKKNENTK